MRFWDSSALISLVLPEPGSLRVRVASLLPPEVADDRLRLAAAMEGFRVLPYSEEVNEPRTEYAAL